MTRTDWLLLALLSLPVGVAVGFVTGAALGLLDRFIRKITGH